MIIIKIVYFRYFLFEYYALKLNIFCAFSTNKSNYVIFCEFFAKFGGFCAKSVFFDQICHFSRKIFKYF